MGIFEYIVKSKSGVYKDTPENRRLHRVGQRYGNVRNEIILDEGELIPGMPLSTKVNLNKYLSGKVKADVDKLVSKVKSSDELWNSEEKLGKVADYYRNLFNSSFDSIPKSKRAFYVELVKQLQNRISELNGGKPLNFVSSTNNEVKDSEKNYDLDSPFEQACKDKGIVHGQPMGPLDADEHNANPNYGTLVDGSFRAYTHNCQTCVVAYELRRRGYDVEARGVNPRKGYLNEFQLKMARDSIASFVKKPDIVYLSTGKRNIESIRRKFLETIVHAVTVKGEGRYFLSFKNRCCNNGHIVVIENLGGNCVLIDPQSGSFFTIKFSDGHEITLTAMKYFESVDVTYPANKMIKVDDQELKPEVLDLMIPKVKE